GGDATPPSDPTRQGYTFKKWEGNWTGVMKDETVTATYEQVPGPTPVYWTVTFYDDDESTVLKTQQVLEGNNATPPANPSKTGYTFEGWDGNWTDVQQDEDVYATYERVNDPDPRPTTTTYTVTFEDFDGTVIKRDRVNPGRDATPPGNPSRPGFEFREWDGNWTNVRRNETVVARYNEIEVEVIEEEQIPEAPPVITPPVETPQAPPEVIEVPVETPAAAPTLPKTGSVGAGEMAGFGALLMAIGVLLKKKKGF
ncbi:InlB B-repeat-containing protein, partial [Gudongella sp. SC589]|uniref:InlB B-repeat-containing protein n=1 Tax=Gudongella sp. SC589 TaxID=3385990 RepID=UPI003904C344